MRCLLDKATARFAVQGLLKLGEGQALGAEEVPMINTTGELDRWRFTHA